MAFRTNRHLHDLVHFYSEEQFCKWSNVDFNCMTLTLIQVISQTIHRYHSVWFYIHMPPVHVVFRTNRHLHDLLHLYSEEPEVFMFCKWLSVDFKCMALVLIQVISQTIHRYHSVLQASSVVSLLPGKTKDRTCKAFFERCTSSLQRNVLWEILMSMTLFQFDFMIHYNIQLPFQRKVASDGIETNSKSKKIAHFSFFMQLSCQILSALCLIKIHTRDWAIFHSNINLGELSVNQYIFDYPL